ncbi:MAG: T9SS type A sorting domain-containing protein, partial [Bacteroidota bacterium]
TTCLDTAAINAECDPNFAEPGTPEFTLIDVTGKVIPSIDQVTDNVSEQSMLLFPNPATEELTVQFVKPFQFGRVKIYNLQGRLVMTQELLPNTKQHQFRVGTLAGGAYLVSVVVDGETFTERLVVIE